MDFCGLLGRMGQRQTAGRDNPAQRAAQKQRGAAAGEKTLLQAAEGREYLVRGIATDDEELNAFLFTLGCYAGEPVTVVARHRGGCVVSIKDGRYNIDNQLAAAILI